MADNFPVGEAQPAVSTERDLSLISDHVTVWIDKHICVENTYSSLKTKFNDNIQVLQSNNVLEDDIDDMSLSLASRDLLEKLKTDVYCLKYFSTIEKCIEYIRKNTYKKIFFISSGTIGKEIVPQIAGLEQIQGIYIFCGNISYHTEWASDYVDYITAMLEHQDNLLERLTRDIAGYLETKGDQYNEENDTFRAKNCYSWSKKLLLRGKLLGDTGLGKILDRVENKIVAVYSPAECQT